MLLKKISLRNNLYVFTLLWLQSCGIFTFSGIMLSPDLQTFSIQEFYTEVSDGPLDAYKTITTELENRILRETPLRRESQNGDLQYEGTMKSFVYTSVFSAEGNKKDTLQEVQRLTITVEVSYVNRLSEEVSFKKKLFSASKDLNADADKESKEKELVKEIIREIVDHIFSQSIDNNW